MTRFIISLAVLGLLTGCSLDASLLGSKVNPDTPNPIDSDTLQIQKIAFDFYIRMPIGFANKMAATPDGNFLFVGAEEAHETFPFSLADEDSKGAVVVYKKTGSTFVQHQVLRSPVQATDLYGFGFAVNASNEWLVVGTRRDSTLENNSSHDPTESGSAILYKWNSTTALWEYSQKMKAPPASRVANMEFGGGLAISGTKLAVYANTTSDPVDYAGVVFMYGYNGTSWQYVQTIISETPGNYRKFGSLPVFDSGKLYLADQDNTNPTQVDIFTYNGSLWNKTTSITSTVSAGSDCATSFAVQGDLMAIGCPWASNGVDTIGKVNIFKHNGTDWVNAGTVSEGTSTIAGNFGKSLSLSGNKLYVSGGFDESVGRISLFEIDNSGTATKINTILPDRKHRFLDFGSSLVISNNVLFASQNQPAKISDIVGAVQLYDISSNANTYLGSVSVDAIPARSLSTNARFGSSIAVSADGSNVLVGTPGNPSQDEYGTSITPKANLGSVQFFKTNTDKSLRPLGDRSHSDRNLRFDDMFFGQSISASGNYAAIGAPGTKPQFSAPEDLALGSVSVTTADFNDTITSWGPIEVFPPNDNENLESLFGAAVKLKGMQLIVGAPEHKLATGNKYGKVLTYLINSVSGTFSEVTTLNAGAYKTADMRFGASLDYDNAVLVIGAPGSSQTPDNKNAAGAGGVWIYNYNGTTATLQNILMGDQIYAANGAVVSAGNSSSWQASDGFGSAVMISGARLFVGSPGANSGAGAVFVYDFNSVSANYDFTERLDMTLHTGQTATANAAFGTSLAMAEQLLVVGAPGENLDSAGANSVPEAGAVFVLKNSGSGYKGLKKFTPSGIGARTNHSRFGQSVAYATDSLYVGSPGHDLNGAGTDSVTAAGAVFIFDVSSLEAP